MARRTVTKNVIQVFAAMVRDPQRQHYAFELSRHANVNIGTIYSVLARLEEQGWVTGFPEEIDPVAEGRPARRYYLLTPEGTAFALSEINKIRRLMSPGESGLA